MAGYGHRTGFLLVVIGYLLLAPLTAWPQQPKSGGTQ
jgi:hypothetical protein